MRINCRFLCTLSIAAVLLCAAGARADDAAQAADEANIVAHAVAIAQPRCVKIYGAGIGREPGYSTGILISADGQILTSSGVYLAGNRIRVVLADGTMHLAQIVRRSDELQTALLKIDAQTPNFFEVPAPLGAEQGDWVVAVSNLFKVADGTEPLSVNLGVLSLRSSVDVKRGTQDVPYQGEVLLIDAITSTPGASGGALIDLDGRLVGMIGKTMESASTNTRLNYAVPADRLRKFLDGETEPTAAGVAASSGKPVVGLKLFSLSGRRAPAYVDSVAPNSPAAIAGVKRDDLILSIAGESVRNVGEYQTAEKKLTPGQEVPLRVKRKDDVLTLKLIVGSSEAAQSAASAESSND